MYSRRVRESRNRALLESHPCFGYVTFEFCLSASMVTDEEQRLLLAIARGAIASALENRPAPRAAPVTGRLSRPGGAFVTIRLGGRLRGCIGYIESPLPLANVVAEVAVKSALEDPRFPPLRVNELEEASLEVSVLSPMQPVEDAGDIRIGVHGLLLESGGRRGLFLPQVPIEEGWNREEFLENLCRKAGLKTGAWKEPGARLSMFTAEVVHEEHASG